MLGPLTLGTLVGGSIWTQHPNLTGVQQLVNSTTSSGAIFTSSQPLLPSTPPIPLLAINALQEYLRHAISTRCQLSSIDSKSAHAEKLALPGFEPGSSTYRVAALTTMLQDCTDEMPEISHSAIDIEERLEFVPGFS